MDYTAFQTLVGNYLHRSDLSALIPTFIEHGRLRMCDRLRVQEMETYATVTLTAGIGSLSSDVVQVRHVQGPSGALQAADLPQLLASSSEGLYAVVGIDLYAPGCSTVTAYYWERPLTLLGASGSVTRTVLSQYPQLWLYAALAEGYVYLDDKENEAKMQGRLDAEVDRANSRAAQVRYSQMAVVADGVQFQSMARL
jgi:hypothetical protein